MSEMDNNNTEGDQAIYHGALAKNLRIHQAISGLKLSRQMQQWRSVYQYSEDLYIELHAWTPESKKEEYEGLWKELTTLTNDVLKGKGGRENRSALGTVSFRFFLMSMEVMKAANFDTPVKKEYYGSLV